MINQHISILSYLGVKIEKKIMPANKIKKNPLLEERKMWRSNTFQ